ncbi:MAG: GNAT family N-acetyltransferase, partial [Phycisphaerae bacterium]
GGAGAGVAVVGFLRLHLSEGMGLAAYQLRGMATGESVRGRGVGRELLAAAEGFVRGAGVGVMWCNARVPAVGFYEKGGWTVVSGEFEIPTAGPHVRMERKLRDSD